MSANQHIIRLANGTYVYGYSPEHMIVQITEDAAYAKRFSSAGRAAAFLKKYTDAGYGLTTSQLAPVNSGIIPA